MKTSPIAAGIAAIALSTSVTTADEYLAVDFGVPSSPVYRIDTQTRQTTQLPGMLGEGANALTVTPDGRYFATRRINGNGTAALVEIEPTTGFELGVLPISIPNFNRVDVRGLAASPTGDIWATFNPDGSVNGPDNPDLIGRITPSGIVDNFRPLMLDTGLGLGGAQALEFGSDGLLYGWNRGSAADNDQIGLYTVDPFTGIATDVNPAVDSSFTFDGGTSTLNLQSFDFGTDGLLHSLFGAFEFTIDPTTGVVTAVSEDADNPFPAVRGIALIPEPTGLLALSGLGLLLMRRR